MDMSELRRLECVVTEARLMNLAATRTAAWQPSRAGVAMSALDGGLFIAIAALFTVGALGAVLMLVF
jgi:hypothetical protein